jgi:hypothetical protein
VIRDFTTALRGTLTNNSITSEIGPLDGAGFLMKISGYFGQKAITRKTIVMLDRDGDAISGYIDVLVSNITVEKYASIARKGACRAAFHGSIEHSPQSSRVVSFGHEHNGSGPKMPTFETALWERAVWTISAAGSTAAKYSVAHSAMAGTNSVAWHRCTVLAGREWLPRLFRDRSMPIRRGGSLEWRFF